MMPYESLVLKVVLVHAVHWCSVCLCSIMHIEFLFGSFVNPLDRDINNILHQARVLDGKLYWLQFPFVTVAMGLILIVPNHALLLYYASSLVYNTGNM
mmetsp:Transcript_29374/g.42893  ORF Transcript_29374/g.42893 Transcript_29374/m.42893 type:complete len:98 (-) Transcript_29374:268-561(-)